MGDVKDLERPALTKALTSSSGISPVEVRVKLSRQQSSGSICRYPGSLRMCNAMLSAKSSSMLSGWAQHSDGNVHARRYHESDNLQKNTNCRLYRQIQFARLLEQASSMRFIQHAAASCSIEANVGGL
jgi:hypothetical protein